MACWLYQMNAKLYRQERYRTEVWEGNTVTNWFIGEAKRRPKEVAPGDIVILFYAKTHATDRPGIYGWGIITLFDGGVMDFRPVEPSDYLKMNPLLDDEVYNIIDEIRGGFPEMTMWKVDKEPLERLRQKIAQYVYGKAHNS